MTTQPSLAFDCAAMLAHLRWLSDPVRATHPDVRLELAWADPDTGPNRAKTFRIDAIEDAVEFAVWINRKGKNVYAGATLKRSDTPAKGRTRTEHAAIATCLPVDIDGDFEAGARKLGAIAKPQLLILTGRAPQLRGQLWIRIAPTDDMELWSEANRRSVSFSGGDRNALGTYRLMRLAGSASFPSAKKQARGYVQELTAIYPVRSALAYDVHELLERFPATPDGTVAPSQSNAAPTSPRGGNASNPLPMNRTNVVLVQSMLDALPSEYVTEYDLWLRVGFALYSFDDGEIGLALWEQFSCRDLEKAARTDFARLWAGFRRQYSGRKVSLGWLWANAQQNDWNAARRWDWSTTLTG